MKEIRWRSPEFEHYEKGPTWYWLTIIITIILVAFSLWQRNFLFAVFIVIAALVIINWGKKTPREIEFKLDQRSLVIDANKVYPYEILAGFTIRDSELILRRKSRLNPYVKILIPERDRERIKSFLIQHLPEIEYEESLTDHISKLLKF
jgi:hypothetical protein